MGSVELNWLVKDKESRYLFGLNALYDFIKMSFYY